METKRKILISRLDSLKKWLIAEGWKIEKSRCSYEVLRATKEGRTVPFLVFVKRGEEKYAEVVDRGNKTIDAFINRKKKKEI